ncbi:hypothetical protein A3765_24035, partial [Oleiphilus sp. HI0130]
MKTKLILLAHGSSSKEWSDAFYQMTKRVRESFKEADLAFMELSSPSLEEVCIEAKQDGFQNVRVLPLFLAIGRHLKTDVPRMISEYENTLGLKIDLLPPVGQHPAIENAMYEAASAYLSE